MPSFGRKYEGVSDVVCVKSYDFLVFLAANKMMITNHLETTTDLKRLIL